MKVLCVIILYTGLVSSITVYDDGSKEPPDSPAIDVCLAELCGCRNDTIVCVREYLCKGFNKIDTLPIFRRDVLYGYLPTVGANLHLKDTYYSIDCAKVVSFTYNSQTDEYVLTVNLEGAKLDSRAAKLYINQVGKAPKIVSIQPCGTLNLTLTAVLKNQVIVTPFRICKASISASIQESCTNEFTFGSNLTTSNPDPVIAAVAEGVNKDLSLILKQLFLTNAYYFYWAFWDSNLCTADCTREKCLSY